MPFPATVFNVLIASPSDVPLEREAIAASLHEWNALNSQPTGSVLLPVMWESHSAPSMGDRPQQIINDQVVRSCDMLVGAFWTRLGSHTGIEESGTVEEIKWFLKQNKPVMLYYSHIKADLQTVDIAQLDKLKKFKESIRDKGIQESYTTVEELKQKLFRQLTIIMRGMSVDTVIDKRVVQEARASVDNPPDKNPEPQRTGRAAGGVSLVEHTAKSFIIVGNVRHLEGQLSELGGQNITIGNGKKAWNFSKKRAKEIAKLLGIRAQILPKP